MCGIAGVLSKNGVEEAVLRSMTDALAHRGPDDSGIWIDREAGVGLGSRRLAIVDLSPQGHQPMLSADGRLVLIFNGEIYNHRALRAELEQAGAIPEGGWSGHSDTEVLLQAVAVWGLESAIGRAAGMFALALWDRKDRSLSLVRDRFGEKPLYYGWVGQDFVFGSELKSLKKHPKFDNSISRAALQKFASLTYVPAPLSIFEQVYKLPPACILSGDVDALLRPQASPPRIGSAPNGLSLKRYWSYEDVLRAGLEHPIGDEQEAHDRLEEVLSRAVAEQSLADVPVGAFLSGGIDSSTIVSLYQKQSSIPVRSYSIGFEETRFNEAQFAKRVASHLGTVHHEWYVTEKDARDVIPLLPSMYDEPFADASQIPTYLVSHFARRDVTVALTGDGGDELFGGYYRHFSAPRLWRLLQFVPPPVRLAAGNLLSRIPSSRWSQAAALLSPRSSPNFGAKLQKASSVAASARDFSDVYFSFLDEWHLEDRPVLADRELPRRSSRDALTGASDTLWMLYNDATTYLPDDILCKVDRASMSVSLETRAPYLDHRVAELAARIPIEMKVRGGRGKRILRKLLDKYVPPKLVERPKAGFAVPVGEWIKGPLRDWAEDLLDPSRMAQEGWFETEVVQRRWRRHLSGQRESTPAIWAILMFQAWLREQPAQSTTPISG